MDALEERVLLAADFALDLEAIAFATPFEAEALSGLNLAASRVGDQTVPVFAGEWVVRLETGADKTTFAESRAQAESLLSDRLTGLESVESLASLDTFLVKTSSSYTYDELVTALNDLDGFVSAEHNFLAWKTETIPDDFNFLTQWALKNTGQSGGVVDADIDATDAWDINTGSGNVVVGVVDSGVNYTHVDLDDNMWRNPGEIAGDGIDNDGNGFVDDIYGYDFLNGDSDPFDDEGHGTAVAGIIAAEGNNGTAVVGVNWNAQIMALKIFDSAGFAGTAQIVGAINYATAMRSDYGVNVVATNHSWGSVGYSTVLRDAIVASGAEDILFVASAGNASHNNDIAPQYPASYDLDHVISVAATDRFDNLASFSSFGATTVDLGAPGVSTLTTSISGGTTSFGGTSAAAPYVAASAALLSDTYPLASALEIKQALLDGTDPNAALAGITLSGGRLNVFGAMQAMQMQVTAVTPGDGEIVSTPPVQFTIKTALEIDSATVDASDLTVNGIAADAVIPVDGTTLIFVFSSSPVTLEGEQEISIAEGAFNRLSDSDPVKALVSHFRYDTLMLEVVATTPSPGGIVALPVTSLEVDFNETIDAASVGIDDILLSEGTVTGFTVVDGDSVSYDISGVVTDRQLTVQLPAGAVADTSGNPILAYSTVLEVDAATRSAADFERLMPLGGLSFRSDNVGRISSTGDIDSFEFFAEAGQTVSVRITPLNSAATVFTQLVGTGSVVVSAPGQPVVLSPVSVDTDGTFVVEVLADQATDYRVEIVRNAVVEDPNASGQNITESGITIGSRRFSALGSIDFSGQTDIYTVDLSVSLNRPIDIVLASQSEENYSSATFEIIAPDGTIVVATEDPLGSPAPNFDLGILGFVPDQPGDYVLRLTSPVVGEYGIVVTERLMMEAEVNDGPLVTYRSLDDVSSVIGFSSDAGATGLFSFTVDSSQSSLTISGGVGDPGGGFVVPISEQAPGSLVSELQGTVLARLTNDSIELLVAPMLFPFEKPGNFQPGFGPADFAAEITIPGISISGYLALRDSVFGVVGEPIALSPSGGFSADEVSFSLNSSLSVVVPGAITESISVDDTFVDNEFATLGSVQHVGGQLELSIPIDLRILIPVPDLAAAGILDVTGQVVATAPVAGADDVFEITLESGQTVALMTQTPFDGPLSAPDNTLDPAIEIRNAFGFPLDFDDNSAADGRNAMLSFTAPAAGVYQIAVQNISGVGEYVLKIDGHAGSAPVPFEVVAIDPPDATIFTTDISTIVVDFSDLVDEATVDASDLTVDGLPADSVETVDANTLLFSFVTPFGTGLHNVELAGGSIESTDGVALAGFASIFAIDSDGPRVISTSIQEGGVLPSGNLSIIFGFDEHLNDSGLDAADFALVSGTTAATFDADSFVYNPTGSTLTINYSNLPEDLYTIFLFSGDGAFEDLVGNDLDGEPVAFTLPPNVSGDGVPGGDFFVNFALDTVSMALPVPLTPMAPLGSLIYDPPVTGVIGQVGDADNFTINLDPNQTLSVRVDTEDPLHSAVVVFDPDGIVIGFDVASSPGAPSFLQTLPVSKAGTYKIMVGGLGSTTGVYAIQTVLNAALEEEALGLSGNNSLASAQDINAAFIDIASGQTTLTAPTQFDNLFYPNVVTVEFTDVSMPIGDAELTIEVVSDLGSTFEYLTIEAEGIDLGRVFEFDGSELGVSLTTITISEADIQALAADGTITFNVTPSIEVNDLTTEQLTLSLTIGQSSSSRAAVLGTNDGILAGTLNFVVDPNQSFLEVGIVEVPIVPQAPGSLLTTFQGSITAELEPDAITLLGAVLDADAQPGIFEPSGLPVDIAGIVELIPGGLFGPVAFRDLFLDLTSPTISLDVFGNFESGQILGTMSGGMLDFAFPPFVPADSSSVIGIDSVNLTSLASSITELPNGMLELLNPVDFATLVEEENTGIVITATLTGQFVAYAMPFDSADIYRFDLEAGESATIVAEGLSGTVTELELLDSAGNVLAVGTTTLNADQRIGNFVASTAGTYYARVKSGGPDTEYSLVVTKNADFEAEANDSPQSSQDISVSGSVLGAIADDYEPVAISTLDSGWYNNIGEYGSGNTNYFTGLSGVTSYHNFFVFDLESVDREVVSATLKVSLTSYSSPDPTEIYTLHDVVTNIDTLVAGGAGLTEIFDDLGSGAEFGAITLSFSDVGQFIEIELNANAISAINASLGDRFAVGGALTSLGSDLSSQNVFGNSSFNTGNQLILGFNEEDFYSINVSDGDVLRIQTQTPGGGPGELLNDLVPIIEVLDPSGASVLTNTQSASDGRNVDVSFTADLEGTYVIQVAVAEGEPGGEYVLSVSGNTGAPAPFMVSETSPADAAVLQSLTTFTVNFNQAVLLTSVDPEDLVVGGFAATGVTIVDGDTLEFTLPTLPDGTHTIVIASGAITSLSGEGLEAFSAEVTVDTTPPQVIYSSILDGDVFPTGNLTYTVKFSEEIVPPPSLLLLGPTFSVSDELTYDPASSILTATFSGLPEGSYSFPISFFDFRDLAGNLLDGDGDGVGGGPFEVNFELAPLSVVVDNVVVTATGTDVVTGSFEVYFDTPADIASVLAAYNLSLDVTSQNGSDGALLLQSAIETTSHAPVFPGIDPLEFSTGVNLQSAAYLGSGNAPIPDESGIIRVQFIVQAGIEDIFDISFNLAETAFFDLLGNEIIIDTYVNGSIEIILDQVAPTVEEVLVSSTQWEPEFFDHLEAEGLGVGGYSIPTGSGVQLTPLPWVNLDELKIRFSEDVIVDQNQLTLLGTEVFGYAFSGFSYDATTFTASWTIDPTSLDPLTGGFAADRILIALDDSITDLAGNALDGEFENPTDVLDPISDELPSGNSDANGDFQFRFDVLPGDVNGSGRVFGDDVLLVRNYQFHFPGQSGYTAFRDVNGSGSIFGDDVLFVRDRQFSSLPEGSPFAPESGDAFGSGPKLAGATGIQRTTSPEDLASVALFSTVRQETTSSELLYGLALESGEEDHWLPDLVPLASSAASKYGSEERSIGASDRGQEGHDVSTLSVFDELLDSEDGGLELFGSLDDELAGIFDGDDV